MLWTEKCLEKPAIVLGLHVKNNYLSLKIEIFSKKGLFFKLFYDTILFVRKIEQNQLKSKVYIFQIFTRENGHWLETIKYRI